MLTTRVRLALCVDIPASRIDRTKGCCLSVRTVITASMLIWWARKSGGLPSRNITLRTLLIRQDWIGTGVLSVRPDVSSEEAKAARLARYAELRWSSDTSPRALAGGN